MSNEDPTLEDVRKFKSEELKIRVETYQRYLNIGLQVNAFFYVTTGAVLGFYLKEPNGQPNNLLEFFLLLPILMGTVLGSMFIYAARLQAEASTIIKKIKNDLSAMGLDVEDIPDIHLLYLLLRIFGFIFFLVAASLIGVPYLKESTFLVGLKYFAGVAGLIIFGGVLSAYFGIHRYNKNLKAKELEKRKGLKGEATMEHEDLPNEIPNGYRQGFVTAITIFLTFTLAFLRFWGFEAPGDWWWGSIAVALLMVLSLALQIYALWRALSLHDDKPAVYTQTVRLFMVAIASLVTSLVLSMFVFGIGPRP